MNLCCPACSTCIAIAIVAASREIPGASVSLAIQVEQIVSRAGSWIELMTSVLDGFVGQRGKHGLLNAPIPQARLDAGFAVQLADPCRHVTTAEQPGKLLETVRYGNAVILDDNRQQDGVGGAVM